MTVEELVIELLAVKDQKKEVVFATGFENGEYTEFVCAAIEAVKHPFIVLI